MSEKFHSMKMDCDACIHLNRDKCYCEKGNTGARVAFVTRKGILNTNDLTQQVNIHGETVGYSRKKGWPIPEGVLDEVNRVSKETDMCGDYEY